ncbi:glycosyltransferase [Acidiphilium sp. C61]|jgi:glycosyltransferase involved in cell wall biosynthesis|uniref:glycosyltransferase n=1 Tax=Acidiphilium sp. C61 TaxID=1671485 RepID=UPI00157B77D1|nr:glycosyltransferase [Acidiphilium sp. C61]
MENEKLSWIFSSEYRGSRPYQKILEKELKNSVNVFTGSIDIALNLIKSHRCVFHLHWEDLLYVDIDSEIEASSTISKILEKFIAFQAQGGHIVWTVHDDVPHDGRFPNLYTRLREAIAQIVDTIHVHSYTAKTLLLNVGANERKIVISNFPNIAAFYPNDINDDAAKKYFEFDESNILFSFVGDNNKEKEIDQLLDCFVALNAIFPHARLVMAGRRSGYFEERYITIENCIRLIPRFIDDTVMQYVIKSADFVILPYRRALTSGTLSLAHGFGRPTIVPDLPALLDFIRPAENSLTYRAGDAESMLDTMIKAVELSKRDRYQMRELALQSAKQADIKILASSLISRIMDQNSSSSL